MIDGVASFFYDVDGRVNTKVKEHVGKAFNKPEIKTTISSVLTTLVRRKAVEVDPRFTGFVAIDRVALESAGVLKITYR